MSTPHRSRIAHGCCARKNAARGGGARGNATGGALYATRRPRGPLAGAQCDGPVESLKKGGEFVNDFSRRAFLFASAAFGAASVGLPRRGAAALPASPSAIDPLSLVDPELRPPLEGMLKATGRLVVNERTLAAGRKPWTNGVPAATPRFEMRAISGAKGSPDVRVIVVNAGHVDTPPRPVIVHMHGGGFVTGAAAWFVPALQQVAREHDCVVVTVDYRLSPETRFPGALDDNYAALKWVYDTAADLGVDRKRIAVMGESAGGGHAAMLAIAARDRGDVPLAFQLLIYPMLDDRTGSTHRLPAYLGAYVWVPESNRFGWTALLGVAAGSHTVPAGAVPARTVDLAGLPPAFIGVGSIDLFAPEDIEYSRRLLEAGVPTELIVVPGAYHGFDGIGAETRVAQTFRASWNAALARALGTQAMTSGGAAKPAPPHAG
jgi:acetyl esterase/lipase